MATHRERPVTVGQERRGHEELHGLVLLESLLATDWFEEAAEEVGGDEGDLLRAIGHDAADHAEEMRRTLAAWTRAGGEEAARRLQPRVARELVSLVRDARVRTAELLEDASQRAPTAEIRERLRRLAHEARSHAERLAPGA